MRFPNVTPPAQTMLGLDHLKEGQSCWQASGMELSVDWSLVYYEPNHSLVLAHCDGEENTTIALSADTTITPDFLRAIGETWRLCMSHMEDSVRAASELSVSRYKHRLRENLRELRALGVFVRGVCDA